MLCLSEQDLAAAVTPLQVVDAVETAMRLNEGSDCLMPDRAHIEYQGNTLLLMPAFAEGRFGTKLVSVFPGNTGRNKPVVIGTMVLNDGETGETLAVLNGTALTAMRTGAVGAAALRSLAPRSIATLGVIGAGVQGVRQVIYCACVRELTQVYLHDRDKNRINAAIEELSRYCPGLDVVGVETVEQLVGQSEAVIAATTALEPVVPNDEGLLRGRHFIGIGSFRPEMREFPEALYRLVDQVYVDTEHAKRESGDLSVPLARGWITAEQVVPLGRRLLKGDAVASTGTTFFKSVGMALFDLIAADLIYRESKKKNLGTTITL